MEIPETNLTVPPGWTSALWERLLQALPTSFIDDTSPLVRVSNFGLFHYTTAEGLKGIIESNSLFASSAYFLNDSSELKYGRELAAKVLKEWSSAQERATNKQSAGQAVLKLLTNYFASPNVDTAKNTPVFVTCFCEADNLLSQWRAYGQAGGYSIRFPTNGLAIFGLKPESDFFESRLVKIEYEELEQRKRLNAILNNVLPLFGDPEFEQHIDGLQQEDAKNFFLIAILAIEDALLDELTTFKNSAFQEEQEWRLILRPSRRIIRVFRQTAATKNAALRFRTFRGIFVPYVLLVSTEQKLPIRAIRSGPTLPVDRARQSIEMMLTEHEFYGVKISGSEIPVLI
jgi:hypothetical protein